MQISETSDQVFLRCQFSRSSSTKNQNYQQTYKSSIVAARKAQDQTKVQRAQNKRKIISNTYSQNQQTQGKSNFKELSSQNFKNIIDIACGNQNNSSRGNKTYEFSHEDAKRISKKGFQNGEPKLTVQECKIEMKNQLHKLNTDYKYRFQFEQSSQKIDRPKKMTRTIYLKFFCKNCNKNQWTSIAGTFQICFKYKKTNQFSFIYNLRIYGQQCRYCKKLISPLVYKTQMEAMKIFFSVIVINIIQEKPPPQKPAKYYIRENHWHKEQLCQACKLGKCTTQIDGKSTKKPNNIYTKNKYRQQEQLCQTCKLGKYTAQIDDKPLEKSNDIYMTNRESQKKQICQACKRKKQKIQILPRSLEKSSNIYRRNKDRSKEKLFQSYELEKFPTQIYPRFQKKSNNVQMKNKDGQDGIFDED